MIKKLRKYWLVWLTSSKLSLSTALSTRTASLTFMFGKFLRFGFFIYFLFILGGSIETIAGYSYDTLLTFFLVFNLFDLFGQFFFRGIYWFRQQVISGEFDFRLVKPINPLFQALTRQTDLLDIPLLFIVIAALVRQSINMDLTSALYFFAASIIGMVIITAIHIAVAALGVLTTEVDHTMWIYRDLSLMARFPIDIYTDGIKALLTFVVPVGIIFTFPAKAMMGLLTLQNLITAATVGTIFFLASYKFWQIALSKYSSASS
ncbi:ABC transporter permease [Patescibacteria group bacterium]